MDTDYKLNKYISANFVNIKPTEMVFPNRTASGKLAKFSYVSVSSVLELMLSNEDTRNHINLQDTCVPSADQMHSFLDGTIYWEHSFLSKNPTALRLHFYIDEFEMCNPIGSKRGTHKVLAVYYYVGNTDSKYWSEMKFIHHCLLVTTIE